ncbi:MAG: hypothetical protein LBG57_09820 [Treponema sp.]|jgi:hypothetical protein|nr:hypothetical protein [Treponema sp.]
MKKAGIVVGLLLISIVSCNEKEADKLEKFTPIFTMTVSENNTGHLFTVQTNLPESTELLASLYDETGEEILAQDKKVVNDGVSIFGPFRNQQGKLSGKYILSVTMPVMLVQNEKVKKILGENGENIESAFLFNEFDSVGLEQQFDIELSANTQGLTFDEFKAVYNTNAEKFSAEPVNDWSVSVGEKANTASCNFENNSIIIMFENTEPYYVTGSMFVFQSQGDQLKTLQALFRAYALALSFEPEETPEGIINFYQTLFNAEPNTSLKSKSGNTYSAQEVQGNMIIAISKGE